MKVIQINRFGNIEKNKAEIDYVKALGGEVYQGVDGTKYAVLEDNISVSLSARYIPIHYIPESWVRL